MIFSVYNVCIVGVFNYSATMGHTPVFNTQLRRVVAENRIPQASHGVKAAL
jgi:hypothetical protein